MTEPLARSFDDVACTVCGCVCDDLTVEVRGDRATAISPGCTLAEPWLLRQDRGDVPFARVDGQVVSLEAAVNRATQILSAARAPLVYGLSNSSTPGQRAAVRLADRIGACIDTTASTCHAPSIMALQAVGESTASLGEVTNRSDVVVYWGCNPLESHPRHIERFVDAPGMLTPRGRDDRHLIVVDIQRTATAEIADTFLQVEPGRDFELIWALRCMLKGLAVDGSHVGGADLQTVRRVAELLKTCRYGAMFFGLGLTQPPVAHANVEALLRLVTDLNSHTRFIARRMRVPGDVAGADTVLCWQTGFPFSVSLSQGYPRYNPGEYTADDLLRRGEVDAALLVGTEGLNKLSPAAQEALRRIPTIVLESPTDTSPREADVHFTTAVYGIHRPGTAYRMDEVPIELSQIIDSPLPADHEVLQAILTALP